MRDAEPTRPFRKSLDTLRKLGIVPDGAVALEAGSAGIAASLKRAVIDEIPAFSDSGNPDLLPELDEHGAEHVAELKRLFGGGTPGDFDFVVRHARRRAEQRFPLEASLHAYRCGHKVLARWLRKAADRHQGQERAVSAIADFAIDYADTVSTIFAAEYVARTRAMAEADSDRRSELLEILLKGYDESDGRVARLLRRAGYLAQRQAYCVVLARAPNAREMENPARAGRMAAALAQAVSGLPVRSLIGVRDDRVTAVFSATRRQSGWTAAQTALCSRLRPALMTVGPAALIGMSSDQPSTSFVPRGLKEADMALDFANVAERVVAYPDLPLRRVLVHLSGDQVRATVPARFDDLLAADTRANGTLVETLEAYASADMSVLGAARALGVHPNTVYARFARIEELSGLDPQRFHALDELLLVREIVRG